MTGNSVKHLEVMRGAVDGLHDSTMMAVGAMTVFIQKSRLLMEEMRNVEPLALQVYVCGVLRSSHSSSTHTHTHTCLHIHTPNSVHRLHSCGGALRLSDGTTYVCLFTPHSVP
jgi:hypothetical protein